MSVVAGMYNTKPTVLVVDDEPLLRRSYARVLNRFYNVKTAEGVVSAIKLIEESDPAVILSDMMMGDGLGIGLHHALRGTPWVDRMLFASGGCPEGCFVYLREHRLKLLSKPVSIKDLRAEIAGKLAQ